MFFTWAGPALMASWNLLFFTVTLLCEGRVKPNAARYAILYALTIVPAMKGNMDPFFTVLSGVYEAG